MNKVLLLVQDSADVAALRACAEKLKAVGTRGVWVVHSPAICVNQEDAGKQFDVEINAIQTMIDAAKQREDFISAGEYKTQRDAKILERGSVIRDAWKSMPEEQRKAKYMEIFTQFAKDLTPEGGKPPALKVQGHVDHFDKTDSVNMVNSLKQNWFAPFAPGSYVEGWPTSFLPPANTVAAPAPSPVVDQKAEPAAQPAKEPAFPAVKKPKPATFAETGPQTRESRDAALNKMKYFSVKSAATKLGIPTDGVRTPELIKAILDKEFPKAA